MQVGYEKAVMVGLASTFGVLCATFCKSRSAKTFHDAKELVVGRNPTYWFNPTREEFENSLRAILSVNDPFANQRTLTWDHPAAQRIQSYVNAMHSSAQQTSWGKKNMANVPLPKVLLLESDKVNAFVAPVFVSYPAEVSIAGSNTNPTEIDQAIKVNDNVVDFSLTALSGVVIPTIPGDPNRLSQVVERQAFVAKLTKKTCFPASEGRGRVVYNSQCKSISSVKAKNLVSRQTANVLVINTQTLRRFSEDLVMAIVAHELGHYYRGHASDDNRLGDGFFFRESDLQGPGTPAKILDPSLNQELTQFVEMSVQKPPTEVPGEIFSRQILQGFSIHPFFISDYNAQPSEFPTDEVVQGLIAPTSSLIAIKCQQNHPKKSECESFAQIAKNPVFQRILSTSSKIWSDSDAALYSKFQELIASIANSLVIAFDFRQRTLKDNVVNTNELAPTDKNLINSFIDFVVRTNSVNPLVPTMPMAEFLKKYQEFIVQARQNLLTKTQSIMSRKLGWYTYEQEADDIGIELLASVGIRPEAMVDMQLGLLEEVERVGGQRPGESFQACKDKHKNGFGLLSGNTQFSVSLQDWSDPHHDQCYRAFNSFRETRLHKYVIKSRPSFSQDWNAAISQVPEPRSFQVDSTGVSNPLFENPFIVE